MYFLYSASVENRRQRYTVEQRRCNKAVTKSMTKLLLAIAFLAIGYQLFEQGVFETRASREDGAPLRTVAPRAQVEASESVILDAFRNRRSNVQVQARGTVVRMLSDDRDGSRHQRFIVEVAPGHTVLIAHNIDLAPRVAALKPGDRIEFAGEYEWNERGGVIHWTHHDPERRHPGGWIRHRGKVYE